MAKEFALAFYRSTAWKRCRASYIKHRLSVDGGMCERCHDELGYIVHHKIHLSASNILNQSISLNHNNLEYVCKNCHDKEHFGWIDKPLLCRFDENGRPINGITEECHKDIQTTGTSVV